MSYYLSIYQSIHLPSVYHLPFSLTRQPHNQTFNLKQNRDGYDFLLSFGYTNKNYEGI